MVKLKFITRDGALVLRISEGKQRFYKSVKHILIGDPNIEKHWKADKEKFSSYAACAQENNQALDDFKAIYIKLANDHPEYTARQIASAYSQINNKLQASEIAGQLQEFDAAHTFVEPFIQLVIDREKMKEGCNFELYEKLLTKCKKIIPNFNTLRFSDINFDKCQEIAGIFARYNGYRGTAKAFRAVLGRAAKDNMVDFSLIRIGDFHFNDYNPQQNDTELCAPDVLSPEQIKKFLNLDVFNITPEWADRAKVELYYDFCVFMLQSFFAPCDAIKLKYQHITNRGTIKAKRKKTHKAVEVPITPKMREIIEKYRGTTKDGYVFPIMDEKEAKLHVTKDYIFKKFRQRLNIWLKDLGEELGLDFDLYAYVFRHTAITVAVDNGLPSYYVAQVAGTSVTIIEAHYYNGNSEANRDKLQAAFMNAEG